MMKRALTKVLGREKLTLLAVLATLALATGSSTALAVLFVGLTSATEAQSQENQTASDAASGGTEQLSKELKIEEPPGSGTPGSLSPTQKQAMSQGYLVPDQAAYEQAKDEAAAKAGQASAESTSSPASTESTSSPGILRHHRHRVKKPTKFSSKEGVFDPGAGPSDSTGAIGPDRYIELVNQKFTINDRQNNPISQGTLDDLVGFGTGTADVFDPQIMWDPSTERFYYATDRVVSSSDNQIAFGYSTTATPASAADFCHFTLSGFGSRFEDYPKLGDTQNFLLVGANAFDTSNNFLGSDLIFLQKPPSGSGCPPPSTFGVHLNLANIFTPVPPQQVDGSTTGYVVGEDRNLIPPFSSPSSTILKLFQVTESGGTIPAPTPKPDVTVPPYSFPANAPQPNTTNLLDTLDARPTQAVSAIDPSQGGQVAIWTQHTVFGGSGAEVRWYEINPLTSSLFQKGAVSDSKGRYIFNGAISPDRKVSGTTGVFGDSMVLGFNSSSKRQFPDIRMVSKIGASGQRAPAVIKTSRVSLNDGTCEPFGSTIVCRWGDYSAATPDPNAPGDTAAHGQVWLSNQFVRVPGSPTSAGWGSWNWGAKP